MARRPDSLPLSGSRSGGSPRVPRGLVPALPFVLLAGQGCYTYHATELPRLTPGEQIRVELEDERDRTFVPGTSSMLGPRRLEGRFARLTEDSVIVSVWIGEAYAGTPFETAYQDVILSRGDVARVENRQLSKPRTAVVAVGALGVIAYLIDSLGWIEIFPGGGEGGPPEPPSPLIGR